MGLKIAASPPPLRRRSGGGGPVRPSAVPMPPAAAGTGTLGLVNDLSVKLAKQRKQLNGLVRIQLTDPL